MSEHSHKVRRQRREFEPPSRRRFISASAPATIVQPVDLTPPMMGQRKREAQRRPTLNPTPLKA
jgi:hypothetical protein